jgi:signal transduction histidine kinase
MLSDRAALSRASYELRTPLHAILGFGQLLALDSLNESQRHSVEQIIAGGRHLLSLVEDLLDLSRVGELSTEPVEVGEEIAHAVALCRPLVTERSLTVSLDLPHAPVRALADRRRLKQILLNLISNAIKYNRPGGTLTLRATAEPDQGVRIEVIDTGPGMSEAELGRLFVPFERLGAARLGIEGNGLGLAVSKALAEAMGGTIDAASTPGEGSVFSLHLPLVARQVEDVERPARRVIVGVANRQDDAAAHHDRAVPVAAACGQ